MSRTSLRSLGWVVGGSVWLVACGGGVDPDKPLSSTSSAERVEICKSQFDALFDNLSQEEVCRGSGLARAAFATEGDPREVCSTTYQACVSRTDYAESKDAANEDCERIYGGDRGPTGVFRCSNATVGELEVCTNDRVERTLELVRRAPACDALTDADLEAYRSPAGNEPESCRVLLDGCGN